MHHAHALTKPRNYKITYPEARASPDRSLRNHLRAATTPGGSGGGERRRERSSTAGWLRRKWGRGRGAARDTARGSKLKTSPVEGNKNRAAGWAPDSRRARSRWKWKVVSPGRQRIEMRGLSFFQKEPTRVSVWYIARWPKKDVDSGIFPSLRES